jgi:hypothetical protein
LCCVDKAPARIWHGGRDARDPLNSSQIADFPAAYALFQQGCFFRPKPAEDNSRVYSLRTFEENFHVLEKFHGDRRRRADFDLRGDRGPSRLWLRGNVEPELQRLMRAALLFAAGLLDLAGLLRVSALGLRQRLGRILPAPRQVAGVFHEGGHGASFLLLRQSRLLQFAHPGCQGSYFRLHADSEQAGCGSRAGEIASSAGAGTSAREDIAGQSAVSLDAVAVR